MQMKILFLDIETFPNIAYVWGKYQQDVIKFKQQTCIATFVAKWAHKKAVISRALPDYPGYRPGSYNDEKLVRELWQLFDEADVVVSHNGRAFDTKVSQGRFLVYGMRPPSPYQQVDTKLAVKKVSRFNSNKLDDLGELLNIGKKIRTDFSLWSGCIDGEKKAWHKMVKYNRQDVRLLEKLYIRLRPWISNHPNQSINRNEVCPKCGSLHIQWAGTLRTCTRLYRRFKCVDCGGWGRSTKNDGGAIVTNAI